MNSHKVISEKWIVALTILALDISMFFYWSMHEILAIIVIGGIVGWCAKSENRKFMKENPNATLSFPPKWIVVVLWAVFVIQLLILGLASMAQQ